MFVDAIPHVPDHRRLPLLSHLLQKVGPAHYLSVALGLLVSKHVQQIGVKEQVSVSVSVVTEGLKIHHSSKNWSQICGSGVKEHSCRVK